MTRELEIEPAREQKGEVALGSGVGGGVLEKLKEKYHKKKDRNNAGNEHNE
jgi:hypothetical protein